MVGQNFLVQTNVNSNDLDDRRIEAIADELALWGWNRVAAVTL